MKILAFSDLHAHPFPAYATKLENGLNSRANDAIQCVKQITEYVKKNPVDLILFGGDAVHVRKNIDVATFNSTYDAFSELSKVSECPFLMLAGNHDQLTKDGSVHSVHAFRPVVDYVVDKPWWYPCGDFTVYAVPYLEELEVIKEIPKNPYGGTPIFLGHFGVRGALVGSDFVYPGAFDPTIAELNPQNYEVILLGHFHMHQKLAKNAWYIGATHQMNWGDLGQPRGFVVYDTDSKKLSHIPLKAPKFVRVSEDNIEPTELEGNFVNLLSKSPWTTDKKENFIEKYKCLALDVTPDESKKENLPHRVKFSMSDTTDDLISGYVKAGILDMAGLDEEYLIEVGKDILKGQT